MHACMHRNPENLVLYHIWLGVNHVVGWMVGIMIYPTIRLDTSIAERERERGRGLRFWILILKGCDTVERVLKARKERKMFEIVSRLEN
jgi:hypothetical protein